MRSSVRHRQAVPAALRCALTMNLSREYRSSRVPRVLVVDVAKSSVQRTGLVGVVQSLMQATGQAVPQAWQMCAVSVSPPPVSTSAQSMSDEPQSGQTGWW